MYYFSCNLEHVLHDEINMHDDMKRTAAIEFSESYYGKESEFIDFINNKKISVQGNYKETWDFIKEYNHSLMRYSNFHLFFE